MNKEQVDKIIKELETFRDLLSYYQKNRFDDYGPDVENERKKLNRMMPKIKKYVVNANIPTQISGRAPMAMGGAPFTMDIFDDMFMNERTPLAVDLNNTLDAVDKCIGIIEGGVDLKSDQKEEIKMYPCGPLGNDTCSQRDFVESGYSDKNVFLDIPYTDYEEREKILRDVVLKAGLKPIVAKDLLTSNAVLCKVCKIIQTCKYGVSDISFDRHSVSYELGLMHGFGFKVCILLQETVEKFSDIEGLEHASYNSEVEARLKLTSWIEHNVPSANIDKVKDYRTKLEKELNTGKAILFSLPVVKKKINDNFREQAVISKQYSDERLNILRQENKSNKCFMLSATPIPLEDETIDTNDSNVKELFKKPSYSRGYGWNLSYSNFGEKVTPSFEGIEKESGKWKLKLFRNGYFEFVAEIDILFSWSQNAEEYKVSPRFNPHAIIEFPASFIKLIKEFVQKFKLSESYVIKMAYLNCGKYKLRPHSPDSISYRFADTENEATLDNWICEKIFQKLDNNTDIEAFSFVQRLYNTFSFEGGHIPFFNDDRIFDIPKK